MVFGIVERHKGSLDIKSEIGRGTTFIISLPLHYPFSENVKEAHNKGSTRSLRILLVEDEPAVREVIKEYLIADGHQVEAASDGGEGLQLFRESNFDLVITDLGMPEISGDKFAAKAKEMDPAKPIILLTGFGELMSAAGKLPRGVDIIVSKPATLKALRNAIAKLVR